MSTLQIYRASAGSGKTHVLTRNYLILAFKNPEKFSGILAVTFTNKAAGEMKERILQELDIIIKQPNNSLHLESIRQNLGNISLENITKRARYLREQVLHNYSHFAVSTIDSFVQKIIRSFSYEIGARTGYRIEMDQRKVIEDISEMLYQQLKADEDLLNWLIKFAHFKISEGENWDFRRDIKSLAKELFNEEYQKLVNEGANPVSRQDLQELYPELIKMKTSFEKGIRDIATQVRDVMKQHDIINTYFGRNFNTFRNYFMESVPAGEYTLKNTLYKMKDDEEKWFSNNIPDAHKTAMRSAYPALNPLLKRAIDFVERRYTSYVTAQTIMENFYSFAVMADLNSLLPQYRENNNLLLISDSNIILRNIIANNDAPFIYEKAGNRYQNILIDEFQDTSRFQWDNFRPLITNSVASGKYNLIVGDVKQSIYRWRGGDWKLLYQKVQQDIGEHNIKNTTLNTNWRSTRNVIRFNNTLFRVAPGQLQHAFNEEIKEIASPDIRNELQNSELSQVLQNAYADVEQKPPHSDIQSGTVNLRFFEKTTKKPDSWKEHIQTALPEKITDLIREQGYSPGEIAILVRKNAEAREAMNMIIEYQKNTPEAPQFSIVSPDALTLYSSDAVRLIIAAMKFIKDPDNQIARTNLMYLQNNANTPLSYDEVFFSSAKEDSDTHILPDEFMNRKDEISHYSIYELTEELIRIFSLDQYTSEQPYLTAFLDRALEFSEKEGADLERFLNWWDETGWYESIELPEQSDALRIMTIHKAKGLSFNVVLVPFCNWRFDHTMAPVMWCPVPSDEFTQKPVIPVKYKKALKQSVFYNSYFEEKIYAFMDALNALYVAFTRPKEQLHVFVPMPGKTASMESSAGNLLYTIINSKSLEHLRDIDYCFVPSDYYDTETATFTYSGETPYRSAKQETETQERKPEIFSLQGKINEWRQKINIKQESAEFFIVSDEERKEKVNYGALMHEILSGIIHPEDVDAVVQRLVFEGRISRDELASVKEKIQGMISNEKAKNWFYGDWQVITEKSILTVSGEQRIPDRILIGQEEVQVIDFKFGKEEEEYKEQVKEYMELVSNLYHLETKGFLYYPEHEKVVTVG